MPRSLLVLGVLAMLSCSAGCRCFPGFNCYADFIDGVGDDEWAFDQWYNPRLDISRAGKPDWCGPVNRRLGPCRCCNQGTWCSADCCWRYPASHPYWYPSRVIPPVGMPITAPAPAATPEVPPPAPAYETPPPEPNPFADPPQAAPPFPAAPLPDSQALRVPGDVLPEFEAPLQ